MKRKNYRDTVMQYVEKLGELDKSEEKLFRLKNKPIDLTEKLAELKKEASSLKQQIDNAKKGKTNE